MDKILKLKCLEKQDSIVGKSIDSRVRQSTSANHELYDLGQVTVTTLCFSFMKWG